MTIRVFFHERRKCKHEKNHKETYIMFRNHINDIYFIVFKYCLTCSCSG